MTGGWSERVRALARPTSPALLVATVLAWPALTAGFTALLRASECVRGTGLIGFVAQNVAQMRGVADCPTGYLGFGPHTATLLGVFAALAATAVLANLAAVAVGHWLARAVAAVRDGIARLLRSQRPERPRATPAVGQVFVDWLASSVAADRPSRQVLRRGPPVCA
ncbi:hypothetical protein [Occultella kanbiaonis]|uniref:hypothetical protein n=1 Tax=Occultella kanbiaonis TaxID=2675754 RepID=UPI0012B9501D|nr:hypothetical protein [Occultella kanbiaonis]